MGEVFLVEHVHTGDRAALKVLHGAASTDPESIERFKREARAPARIQSENVVRVLDADSAPELNGAPFLVMELLNGNDLQKIVAGRGPFPPAEVARMLGQVARALDKAHAIGIVHRDLKPENLFLHQREDGSTVVKILDFGISKTMDDGAANGAQYQLTRTGAVMGTPLYMAMEQALGRRELIGAGTDIWALGLIAIFLLTGEPYWQGKTVPDILGKVLSYAMYPPSSRWPELPPALDRWLLRSCARTPDQRYQSAGEQMAELTEIVRVASIADVGRAATMLPSPAFTPPGAYPLSRPSPYSGPQLSASPSPQMTPSHVTPHQAAPYVTPVHVGPYAAHGYGNVGASTNEPLVQNTHAPRAGMSTGAKLAIAGVVLVALLGAAGVALAIVVPKFLDNDPTQTTYTPPPPTNTTPTPTARATAPQGSIDPLEIESATPKPHATSTSTATIATTTSTATITTTTSAATGPRLSPHDRCKNVCKAGCTDPNNTTECLVRCLKSCPAQ